LYTTGSRRSNVNLLNVVRLFRVMTYDELKGPVEKELSYFMRLFHMMIYDEHYALLSYFLLLFHIMTIYDEHYTLLKLLCAAVPYDDDLR
jgi:hypothetical protein